MVPGRSKVATTYGIVAASQVLAARAGVQILEHGGNAIDAAIATNAVLGLVEPYACGIGGDLFAIYYEAATGALHGLNASGWAPARLTPQFLDERGITEMPRLGIHTVTVPGAVAGWEALRARFGRLSLADILAPAVVYAEEGFPVSEVIAAAWAAQVEKLAAVPHAAATWLVDGRAPRAGEIFSNRQLAGSLRLLARQGADAFYRGEIAHAIVRASDAAGGTMTPADLDDYAPEWVTPVSTTYRGWTVYELPPNTQGVAALMMLNLMEPFPIGSYGFHSREALHVMIESKKLAYADMLRYAADPRAVDVPVEAMLSKRRAQQWARLIDQRRVAHTVEPSTYDGLTSARGSETVYLCAVDRDGNMVSLIQSLFEPFGSGVVPEGTGITLQNRGSLFTLDTRHPNVLAPRKRPLHTIIPGFMACRDARIAFGIMGGFNQAQAHAQFVAHIVDFGLDIQQALEAGRFTKRSFAGPDVEIEVHVPELVRRELEAMGHDVRVVGARSAAFGYGQAVLCDHAGVHFGASDPRHDGAAIPEAPAVFAS